MLIYAVHAFDAPSPVYDWIAAENISSIRFAVISVSGGGEVWPNTGCRSLVIKELEKKGATILVDDMIVMPSNMNPAVNDSTAMWLLKALPIKVKKIFSILLEGNSYRSTKTLDPFRAFATKQEKKSAYKFSKSIKLGMNCTGCGWCANNCPQDNIDIVFRHPEFKDQCVACFRCIYGCPRQAMWSKNAMVIKSGYSLSEIEKRIPCSTLKPIDECCSGKLFKGVLKYLKEAFPNN